MGGATVTALKRASLSRSESTAPAQMQIRRRAPTAPPDDPRQERLGIAHTSQQSMHMKDRLTVTVDAELAAHARQVAHSRGTSVSGLLESLLREALAPRPRRSVAFADRWSGQFSVTPNTTGDARLMALKTKHSLE